MYPRNCRRKLAPSSKPIDFPTEKNHKLALTHNKLLNDPSRSTLGGTACLSCYYSTRVMLCYPCLIICKSLRRSTWMQLMGYEFLLRSYDNLQVHAFCDADWGVCPHTRRSLTGYLVMIGRSLESWKTEKQTTISRSSVKVEYRSMATTRVSWYG